jgi:hypothetical protein
MKDNRSKVSFTMAGDRSTKHQFCCIQCLKPCSDLPYSFGGRFACESCVRAYYRMTYPDISEVDIAVELRCREYQAAQPTRKHASARREAKDRRVEPQ